MTACHARVRASFVTAAVPFTPQVAHGAVFLNTRLQTRARAAAAGGAALASSAPAMAHRASAYPAPKPKVKAAKANAKSKGSGKGNTIPKPKAKGATSKARAAGENKSRGKGKGKGAAGTDPATGVQVSALSFDALLAGVEAETTAMRAEAARDGALLAEYQAMTDLCSQLPAMALPALDQVTLASMLSSAAFGGPEDVISWLAADQQPTAVCHCDDSEFVAMCAAFGLLCA